jgi:cytidylate kinase
MKYRVVTISGQYGSGARRVATLIAEALGWRLIDRDFIDEVTQATHIECSVVEENDERVTDWLHRVNREALRAFAMISSPFCRDQDFFDADCMAGFATEIIRESYVDGNCIIVGRGAQCILHDRRDAFKVFIYAPQEQRLRSVRLRTRQVCGEDDLRETDNQRAAYVRAHFGRYWQDPDLYDLMISSEHGNEITASTILNHMEYKLTPIHFWTPTPAPVRSSSAIVAVSPSRNRADQQSREWEQQQSVGVTKDSRRR